MERISLGSEPRMRYVTLFRDKVNAVAVLPVASGLVLW